MMSVRVRFAPSPTGYLHVGGARTALFNWLFARHHKGSFILRIEDTDVERSEAHLTEGILEALKWLELNWDEGPYYQSQRLEKYRQCAAELVAAGHAYPCYCPPESFLGPESESEAGEKRALRKYPGTCRRLTPAEREAREREGRPPAIRFRVPEGGRTGFADLVYGKVEVEHSEIEDFVLLRSSGLPTYQLGCVVDDLDMRITHVIRGADHISNTPKQILLYRALGAEPPTFAHVPLILGPDRTRLSKRHGATSVMAYQEAGLLPEALRNFLALLGWSSGDDTEILFTDELIRRFSLEAVRPVNAVFDPTKLEWMNAQYLQRLPLERLLPYVARELKRAGFWRESYGGAEQAWFRATIDLLRPRARNLRDFSTWARAFFSDEFDYDPAATKKFLQDARLPTLLGQLANRLERLEPFAREAVEATLRGLAEEAGLKAAVLINASRVALTGQGVAPGLFDLMMTLGKEKVVARLRQVPYPGAAPR